MRRRSYFNMSDCPIPDDLVQLYSIVHYTRFAYEIHPNLFRAWVNLSKKIAPEWKILVTVREKKMYIQYEFENTLYYNPVSPLSYKIDAAEKYGVSGYQIQHAI